MLLKAYGCITVEQRADTIYWTVLQMTVSLLQSLFSPHVHIEEN